MRQKALFENVLFGDFKFVVGPLASSQIYELETPRGLSLSVRLRPELGVQWEDVPSRPDRLLRRLTLNLPIAVPERMEAARAVFTEPDVLFTTFSSWNEMARWWWAMSRERFEPDTAVRGEAGRLAADRPDIRTRLEAIHAFVTREIRYLSVGFGSGRYEPRPAPEVLSTRYGDCKGKHALLAALGAAVGIEVSPVLVNSTRPALHDDVPSPAQFDHLISVVAAGDPSQWIWIDSTNDLAPMGYLPPNLRGKRALLIDNQGERLVTIPDEIPFATKVTVETNGRVDEVGPLRANVRWTLRGDLEFAMRAATLATPREQWPDLGKALAEEWTKGVVSEVKAADAADVREPFWIEYAVEHKMTPQTFAKDWGLWVPLPEIELPQTGGPSAPGTAVLAGADETTHRARVEIPEGMVARAPLSVTLDRPFASYRSKYAVDGRLLTVERELVIRQRKIPAEEKSSYEAFRAAVKADWRQEFPMEAFAAALSPSLETADALNDAGVEAFDRGKFEEAADLLRRAVDKDPRHKWAWNNLGRAQRRLHQPEEALRSFDRQIEINPYDLYAYENRGATLYFDLSRPDDAEKDFLKQIEIAPLEYYAYRDLASLKTSQGRWDEAADLLGRAVSARPSDKELWLALSWARARAGRVDTAAAVERAIALDSGPRAAIIAARALAAAGDVEGAARIVAGKLPALLASLDSVETARLESESREREVLFVSESWRLLGASALRSGDLSTAERYLVAAWELASTPDAAADLGALREKQGRLPEAIAVWANGSFFPSPRGNASKRELDRVVGNPAKVEELVRTAPQELAKRHVQKLPGSAPEKTSIRLRLLVDEAGRVRDVRAEKSQDAAELDALRDRVLAVNLPSANPDGATFQVVRGGTLECHTELGCNLGLDLYGDEVSSVLER
jgi:tetratricopeptide (TPR) repeat protein